jgi:HEAT repeat protein
VRSRTARGIIAGGGQALTAYVPRLLRDESSTVALVTASALAESGTAGTVEMLAKRLGELEGDKDLPLAREIIKLLGNSPSPLAETALQEVADRGSFLRKGRYAEMKHLAQEALKSRQGRGGA